MYLYYRLFSKPREAVTPMYYSKPEKWNQVCYVTGLVSVYLILCLVKFQKFSKLESFHGNEWEYFRVNVNK